MQAIHSADVVIIGGGIAGLWTLNRLCNRGYNALLLENRALGSFQTVASQGMIHGGIKYTLGGALTGASEAIADMPNHWRACMSGEGDVDLTRARILSDHFYLWSTANLTSRFSGFLASKVTRGRVDKVSKKDLPPLFHNERFHGTLYRLVDMVVDTTSVIETLADNYRDRVFQIDWNTSVWVTDSNNRMQLRVDDGEHDCLIKANAFILTAGKGNGEILTRIGAETPKMQCRPLHQVMVKHRYPHTFYGHCITTDKTPRLTISSHPMADGSQVWYLGGNLSEKGVHQPPEVLIATAQNELQSLLPWVELSDARWATLPVERAEPRQHNFSRPDNAYASWVTPKSNVIAAWPTKLTLSPHLADEVETLLRRENIMPSNGTCPPLNLPTPDVSPTPWEEAFAHGSR